jgi:uncharacterized protein (DUF58 family)
MPFVFTRRFFILLAIGFVPLSLSWSFPVLLSRFGLVWCQTISASRKRSKFIRICGARANGTESARRAFLSGRSAQSRRRGEGREFESMRDYVRGDELRHISWTATARRSKLTTRQYQIERDQTILIALDAGRLMTGRIGDETKFDTAIHAALALMSRRRAAATTAGSSFSGAK